MTMTAAPALTAQDRCDRCRAQAVHRTEHSGSELLWCEHHFREHEDKLTSHERKPA